MTDHQESDFDSLCGWHDHDHEAAFAAFLHVARGITERPPTERPGSARAEDLLHVAQKALSFETIPSRAVAKSFFEKNFTPQTSPQSGLLTGYYEPDFEGSRTKTGDFPVPLHNRPPDLVPLTEAEAIKAGFTTETSFARQTGEGLCYHLSRAEIMAGGLDGKGLELVWLKNAFDAYIIHIQGSGRIRLEDGTMMRVAFDGKSGHPYRSLGKLLIERGIFTPETISMDALMGFLLDQGAEGLALLAENPSYIFFKQSDNRDDEPSLGPRGAAGVPLQPMRSVAVDRHLHTFGLPFWLETSLPKAGKTPEPFEQLVFAQDTGSAIKGAARADLFVGTGDKAGHLAGQLQQETRFTILMPKPRTEKPEVTGA